MTLRSKLLLAQLPLAIALVVVAVVSRGTFTSLDRHSQTILKDNHASVLGAQRMHDSADELARIHSKDEQARLIAIFERDLRFQEDNITEKGEAALTSQLHQSWGAFKAQLDRGDRAPLDEPLRALRKTISEVIQVNQHAMVRKSEATRRTAERMSAFMLAATVAACVLGIFASVWLTNRLIRPLWVLTQAVRRLGEGDLVARARVDGGDEIAQVAHEFNTMADRLAEYRSSSLGELLQAQRSSQAAIDSLPDPVLVLDTDRTLLNVNRSAEALFGISVEAQAHDPFAHLDDTVREMVLRCFDHVIGGKGVYVPKGLEEAQAVPTSDGTRFFLPRANPVIDEDGAVIGLTITLQDVTRLRRFDELKSDLVATVAHEFRTPLTSLRMAIHLCAEGTVGPLTPKQGDLLAAAREDCERLQSIVDDLLDLSRIQAGRIELHVRPVSSESLIAHALDEHRQLAREKQVDLAGGAPTIDRPVSADPDRVQLVLGNLIQNALRHTPAGGRVSLRAAPDDGQVRFEVADTGPGIAREHLSRLFERFFRVPGTAPGGAGLGLYICKEIAEAHGGRVGVESEPGEGSIFWFTLPLT
jgi:two-component system, NtrC family, sensor histidine kinase KinB